MIHTAFTCGRDRVEQVDCLEPGARRSRRRPEFLHDLAMQGVVDIQMRGEQVREPADLATAHGIRLTGNGERAACRATDAPRRQMAVEDALTLSVPADDWFTPCV